MVFKQVIFNVIEYLMLLIQVQRKINKVEKLFNEREASIDVSGLSKSQQKVAKADLLMHRIVER